ncbi:MAG: 4-hydroxythreonine-4-phosphate dehydrogenase PdxA [Gammaproteobacteria bacterium RBG_16_51_14]|nr:MAG: 4-hydroxythreonine-4-phosphate dehydrogenase PdxA [Gammaproteobacteria bacterium RBG_16_51_14]
MPRLVLTAGEPAGIGPDLIIQTAQHSFRAELVVIGDPDLFEARASRMKLPLRLTEFDPALPPHTAPAGHLQIMPLSMPVAVTPGQPDPVNADYVLESLRIAVQACLEGSCDAMVTAPVQKATINAAGFAFSGHTEFIADLCGRGYPVMMLVCPGLRVALVTTHLPLAQVAGAITKEKLEMVLTVIDSDLKTRFGIPNPRIRVCGLNPHAGEDGYLGREEIDCIIPVITNLAARKGMRLHGPVPADTAFTPENRDNTDVFLAMYHDQGLPVLKALGFGQAVNITLGLPIIRTSVDHGTALSLAGTGKANINSMLAAIHCAIRMSLCQKNPGAPQTGMEEINQRMKF